MKKTLVLFSALLSTYACPCDATIKEGTLIQSFQKSEQDIAHYAQTYLDYLKKLGETPAEKTASIPAPFSVHCRKIMNGEVVANNATEFVHQLSGLRKACTSWTMDILEIIPSTSTKSATLRYTIKAPPLGTFTVIKVARFDDAGKVVEINEVFSPLKEEKQGDKK